MNKEIDRNEILIKSIVVEASPDRVFNALANENELQKWAPASQRATLEKRVGGAIQFVTIREDTQETYMIRGKVLDLVPGKKLSYTWSVDAQSDYPETIVTWTLESAENNNKTKVTLDHSGIKREEHKQQANAGWSYFVDRLGG